MTALTDIRSAILKMDTLAAFDLLTDLVEEVQARASDTDRDAMCVKILIPGDIEPFDLLDEARDQLTRQREDDKPNWHIHDQQRADYYASVL